MLTDDAIDTIAQEHVRKNYGPDPEILKREFRSNPDGIYFFAAPRGVEVYGSGGFFVTRMSGEVWEFGSGQIFYEGLDYWLNWYAEGWRPGAYRLKVRDIKDPRHFARLLVEQHVEYLVRELAHGTVWKTYIEYDENTILRRLGTLPCTFVMDANQLREILPALREDEVAVFDYCHIDVWRKYDWRPENNTPDLLGPQWEEAG